MSPRRGTLGKDGLFPGMLRAERGLRQRTIRMISGFVSLAHYFMSAAFYASSASCLRVWQAAISIDRTPNQPLPK
jgi:hypothetical protein